MATVDVKVIEPCCAPVTDSALSEAQADDLAAAFRLLADPVRLRILSLIATAPGGELCACDLPPVLYLQGTADIVHPRPQLDRFVKAYRARRRGRS